MLLLRVNEGNKLYIKEVSIEGLEQEDPDDLAGKLSLKTRGLLSWITGSGVLKEEELERDSQLLQATLVNKGYIDARVAAPEVVYDPDGIRVIFRVREGDRYKLGEVGFSGDLIDTREKLLAQTKLDDLAEDGEYFNLETMQEDIKKLTRLLRGLRLCLRGHRRGNHSPARGRRLCGCHLYPESEGAGLCAPGGS